MNSAPARIICQAKPRSQKRDLGHPLNVDPRQFSSHPNRLYEFRSGQDHLPGETQVSKARPGPPTQCRSAPVFVPPKSSYEDRSGQDHLPGETQVSKARPGPPAQGRSAPVFVPPNRLYEFRYGQLFTRLVTFTLPRPVAKSQPVLAGYASSRDVSEVERIP
jgi:hypothetical protein